jgi:flagellar protein FlaG
MDNAVLDIKPLGQGSSVGPEYSPKEARVIKPVPRSEGSLFRKTSKDAAGRPEAKTAGISPEQTKALAESVQDYLADLNTNLSFEVHETTGEVVVKVVDRSTKEVIRQIPPEALLQLHDKLEELRGVLFNGKA